MAIHQLIIDSMHDAKAHCLCGKWHYGFTGRGIRKRIEEEYRKHLADFAHKTVWVCPDCGSENVQEGRWVNVNTGEMFGHTDENDYWCDDCGEHFNGLEEKEV